MEHSSGRTKTPEEHILSIFKEYTTPSRVLRSFTNLSDTVIQTALSGQSKFVLEILQNADDAFEDQHESIEVKFILQDNYLIVHHNGKGFDYNDVERICDYASQIEEVKATDLRKTGYKGLGFKTLFNVSDCIYIYSNGYSFRFDKTYWPNFDSVPWQIVPIWCRYDELPLNKKYSYVQPVNFIMKVNNVSQLEKQLREIVNQPELLLYLNRINMLSLHLNVENYFLERRVEKFGIFNKIDFYKNHHIESTWILITYKRSVLTDVQRKIQGASRFIYPDKIKKATEVHFTFALKSNENLQEISKIRGLCYSTLPTQLHLMLPYHTNSLFILNLDRTQLHENEWNEFLICQIGSLQLSLLQDLAKVNYLKNYVVTLFVREINHLYKNFNMAFSKGFNEAKSKICWLPPNEGSQLLKLSEAWTDETEFFKQKFETIYDYQICPYLIDYDVKHQSCLSSSEANHFTYDELFRRLPDKYYPQLTQIACRKLITYLYEKSISNTGLMNKLKAVPFLLTKKWYLVSPRDALLASMQNPIPDFLMLDPINNDYLPTRKIASIMVWLSCLGVKLVTTHIDIIRESILKWIDFMDFGLKITGENHVRIINYLAKGFKQLTCEEMAKLSEMLPILTESNKYRVANTCYLPNATSIKELWTAISDDEKISSCYDMNALRGFFIAVGVQIEMKPIDVLRKSILLWISNGEINNKLTIRNYNPIIEFTALHFPAYEYKLTRFEKSQLEKLPVLTNDRVFQKAELCYFDSAIPKVNGLELAIAKSELVSTENISEKVCSFLTKIGVSGSIAPANVMRRTILKWIQQGEIKNMITLNNHQDILEYIGREWSIIESGLEEEEISVLTKLPILTESNTFRSANTCYGSIYNFEGCKEIPGLKYIIAPDELVSLNYKSDYVKIALKHLGVHNITFINIYDRYSDYLTHSKNVKWFFSQLHTYWSRNKPAHAILLARFLTEDQLLTSLKQKFCNSPCLLARNDKMYKSTELYSSRFDNIHDLSPNSILLLKHTKLPEDLEIFLGFKKDLDFECIKRLLKALEERSKLGEDKTLQFFTVLLEQLRLKDNKNEIKENELSLLANNNKLTPAKDLFYFIEEDKSCRLDSHYLKRISGMTHKDTLELAELCGVNILQFNEEITKENKKYDNTLHQFYLERLTFIVFKESKVLNEEETTTLRRLYHMIRKMKLYQCENMHVKYPFGELINIQLHIEDLTFFVVDNWVEKRSKIHDYLKKRLNLKADIRDIIDMISPNRPDAKEKWISNEKLDPEKFYFVEEQLRKLQSSEENGDLDIVTPAESMSIAQLHYSEYEEEKSEDNEMLVLGEIEEITDMDPFSSDENSMDHSWAQPYCKKSNTIKQDTKRLHSSGRAKSDRLFSTGSGNTAQPPPSQYKEKSFKHSKILVRKTQENTVEFSYSSVSSIDRILSNFFLQKVYSLKEELKTFLFCGEGKLDALSSVEGNNIAQSQLPEIEEKYLKDVDHSKCKGKGNNFQTGKIIVKKQEIHITETSFSDENVINHILDEFCSKIYSLKDELKELLFCAERKLDGSSPIESINAVSSHLDKFEENDFKDNKIEKEIIVESSLVENHLVDQFCNEFHSLKPYAVKSEKGRDSHACSDKAKVMKHHRATISSNIGEDILKPDTSHPVPCELQIDDTKQVHPEIPSNYYSSMDSICFGTSRIFEETSSMNGFKQWLSEKFVFTFLQDHYKNKYPNSQSNVSNGIFMLQWQSNEIEIIWVNQNGEKLQPYDFLLKKGGKVKRLIEVKSPVANDSFIISHSQFITNSNQITAESPEYKDKYCVYCIFYEKKSSKPNLEDMNDSAALFKVVPLKNV